MKKGWTTKRLGDACERITQGPNPKYDKNGHDDFRVLKTKDLYDDVIHYDLADRISKDVFSRHLRAELRTGDVLLAIVGRGSINKSNVFETQEGKRFIFTRALGLLRPIREQLDPNFLKHFLHSSAGKRLIDAGIAGMSGQEVVTTTHLKNLEIPLPPLSEQQRIVRVLDEALAGLTAAQANAERNLQNASALFASCLHETFTVRAGEMKGLVKSLCELVEEGLVQLTRGKVISKKDIAACPGNYPVYSSAKEGDGKFGEYGRYMFDEELITWSVDGGGRLFHRPKHCFSVTNVGGILRVLHPARLDYKYLFYVLTLRHSETSFDWVRKAHPSVIKKLYVDIPLPPLAEQRRIVGFVDTVAAESQRLTQLYEQKQVALAVLKKSLLNEAFSGNL